MLKIGDSIQNSNTGEDWIVTNITEFGVMAKTKPSSVSQYVSRNEFTYDESNNRRPREIMKELSDHITTQFDEVRKNESEIHKLKEQVKQLTQELKYAKVRAKSDDNAQFVAFCAFLIMTILFAFTFGLWVTA